MLICNVLFTFLRFIFHQKFPLSLLYNSLILGFKKRDLSSLKICMTLHFMFFGGLINCVACVRGFNSFNIVTLIPVITL